MKALELAPAEAEILRDVTRSYLAELEVEIHHTDSRDFKAMLKSRKELLDGILKKLAVESAFA